MPNFTVVGAGVIGLTVALTIQETIKNAEVTIIAELTPEDPKNIRYTSQWAGAHQAATLTGPVPDPKQLHYDKETYRIALEKYKKDPSMPLLFLEHKQFFEFAQPEGSAARRMGEWLPDYAHFVDKDKLPQGCLEGIVYKSFSYDTPNYLLWLWNKFKANGGKFVRKTLSHLDEAITQTPATGAPAVLIHCSGLGARGLVQDTAMYPTRGQTVIVRAPWVKGDFTRKLTDNDSWYIIPRKSGDVILGGTREADDAWPYPRPETSEAIRQNCVKLFPELLPPEKRAKGDWRDLDIVSENVGLRPTRHGGVRLEKDSITTPSGQKIPVVHCCRSSFSIASPDFVANDADSSSYLDETDMVAAASNRAGPAQWMR